MTQLTVRGATRADAPAIATVRVAGWRAGYAGILDEAALAALDPVADAARWLATWDTGPRRRVAESAGRVVGFATFGAYRSAGDDPAWPHGPDDGELMALYVDPGAWSRGVGSALMADAVAGLAAAGHPVVRLWVLQANDRARRFYASRGFVDEGVVTPFAPRDGGAPVPEVRYRRTLR